jgi:hypothetical protein
LQLFPIFHHLSIPFLCSFPQGIVGDMTESPVIPPDIDLTGAGVEAGHYIWLQTQGRTWKR